YMSCLEKYFDFARNQLKIDPLKAGARHLLKWMCFLKEQGLSRSRLIHHKSALTYFFALLVNLKKIDHNPAKALFTIRKKKSDFNQPISEAIAYKLLRSLKRETWLEERNFMMISLLWGLGLRVSELTSLKVGDFELEDDIGLLRVRGKGKKQRVLFVVDKLYNELTDYLKHAHSPREKSSPLFPIHSNRKKAVSSDRVQTILKESACRAGIEERITPHVLRHSFATHMYSRRVPVSAIEVMLGHTSSDETSIYIHVAKANKQQALATITIEKPALSTGERR
ncbi:MAG: tyrosine-type recombinase/integrase, partial [Anaerolineaceae bacterium]|nr:tyrosine-type recombinase/integrase [Anaerolineaceae bacterium]